MHLSLSTWCFRISSPSNRGHRSWHSNMRLRAWQCNTSTTKLLRRVLRNLCFFFSVTWNKLQFMHFTFGRMIGFHSHGADFLFA